MCHRNKTGWVMKIVTAMFVLAVFTSSSFAEEKLASAGGKQGPEIFVQLGHTSDVSSVAFSPDGKYTYAS
jgi:WD40 repeat protein